MTHAFLSTALPRYLGLESPSSQVLYLPELLVGRGFREEMELSREWPRLSTLPGLTDSWAPHFVAGCPPRFPARQAVQVPRTPDLRKLQ